MNDLPELVRNYFLMESLRANLMMQAIQALQIRPGARMLDAGCGIGLQSLKWAQVLGPNSHIDAVDIDADSLAYAETHVLSQAKHLVTLHKADIGKLDLPDEHYDLVWSVDCAGYIPDPGNRHIIELSRVLKKGKRMALLFWGAQTLLPGHPQLEARLNASASGIVPYKGSMSPSDHPLRLAGRLQRADIHNVRVHTFTGHVAAPVGPQQRQALLNLFQMRWDVQAQDISEADKKAFNRLCNGDSPECILDQPDYCALYTYVMFTGSKGKLQHAQFKPV